MDSSEFDCYVLDLDSIKDDMITMEKLLKRLQDGSEQIKTVHSATSVKELQDMMDSDIDDVFIVAKSITQCLEGLQRSNPSADMKASPGPGSSVDRTRMNVVMEIGKKLKEMMDGFQWLGLKIVAAHKESVETIYYRVTKEKQSMENIEKFVASGEIETFLRVAEDEEGDVRIVDVVQEIQERINGSKYMQKCLGELQSMFSGMVALVETQRKKLGGGGKEKTAGAVGGGVGGGGRGGEDMGRKPGVGIGVSTQLLHSPAYDHEREAKKRAIIAIILTAISIVVLILILAKLESDDIEKE